MSFSPHCDAFSYTLSVYYSHCFTKVSSEFKFELIFDSMFNYTMQMEIWVSQNPLSLGFTIGTSLQLTSAK